MSFFKIIILLFSLWIIGFACFIKQIPNEEPVIKDSADAIIVLTGAKGRIDAGLRLLQQNKAKHLFISGVGKKVVLEDLSKYLVYFPQDQAKILQDKISLGHSSSSTKENAAESSIWINNNNYKKIILVTSNYHMLRSLYLFNSLMPEIEIIAYPVARASAYDNNFKLMFFEYNKFLWALIR